MLQLRRTPTFCGFDLRRRYIKECNCDCWLPKNERANLQYRRIDTSEGANVTKIRLNTGDKDETKVSDKNVAKALSNRFYNPLDFEILDTDYPYHQHAFRDVLEYELTIGKFGDVIKTSNSDAKFTIDNITLEFEKITNEEEAKMMEKARKMFAGGVRKNPFCNDVNKQLHNSDITMDKFYNAVSVCGLTLEHTIKTITTIREES
ncbi:hypothetical protein CAPTEDRAFT_197617 [Capitella teleta]|uniref:Uncharacterized protein n=1 Tax=Capitella teleta TaxID=283909 RepID=R7VDX6_CAPTE|nr:hypothetical protein CAPTEDRAFT_197617 [Capitella teleta]|eukprot:ELU16752.1 hypothetical protein CAPTEDRAFT_197617 [Capitella teleta]